MRKPSPAKIPSGVNRPAMTDDDNRQISRDSLFVMADLRIDGIESEHRIRVRNLSAGGLMAEGGPTTQRGQVAWVNLRNIGWTEGSVAWVEGSRFGIAFRADIDPQLARAPLELSEGAPRFVRTPMPLLKPGALRQV